MNKIPILINKQHITDFECEQTLWEYGIIDYIEKEYNIQNIEKIIKTYIPNRLLEFITKE